MTTTLRASHRPAAEISHPSLVHRLREVAHDRPDRVAMRYKRFGIWEEIDYGRYWERVRLVAMAFWALGVRPGEQIAIHSENRPEWLIADLAAQGMGARSVGLYPTNPPAEVRYLLGHSESRVLIAEDQEQVDKVLEVKDSLPNLERVVYLDPRGVGTYRDPVLLSWEELIELGREEADRRPELFEELMEALDPDDCATIVYTSGTTGPPKGSMLSHRNLVFVMENSTEVAERGDLPEQVELLSYLPLCHVFEKLYSLLLALQLAATVNFAESIETVVDDLREVQPTLFPGPPRIWEKMAAGVQIRMSDASLMKRLNFKLWMRVGTWLADRIIERGDRGLLGNLLYGLGYLCLYRSLKEKLGLRHCRGAISGAAPVAPEVLKFFMAIGVPIYEGYGQTENTAYCTVNREGEILLGSVGSAHDHVELRLDEDGEILVRHPGVFIGYYKDPGATAGALTEDGWLRTGDVGVWEEGRLRIVDRKKDIIITSGGKNISPSEIENKLKVSPFVKEAVVIGERRKHLTALIGIEFEPVASWAQRRNLAFTTYRDLSEKPEVMELVRRQVDRVNEELARVEQIKKFRLLPKELDHEQGELTATQKVKRKVVEEQFADLIQSMYREG